jgi:FKBP-type peptidyl-prolyl cis-trans isomerase
VAAHYAGRLLDGSEFDSSYSRGEPLTIAVGGVIKGWTEALLMMKEGDKWTLFVPPELGYGERGVGPIPANSALIFDIELVEVK